MWTERQAIEVFHLHFLRSFSARVDATARSGRVLGAQADGDYAALEDPASNARFAGLVSYEDRIIAPSTR